VFSPTRLLSRDRGRVGENAPYVVFSVRNFPCSEARFPSFPYGLVQALSHQKRRNKLQKGQNWEKKKKAWKVARLPRNRYVGGPIPARGELIKVLPRNSCFSPILSFFLLGR
jgi:hypothetical protein